MECRKFEVTLISAENLPDVRNFGQMKVYAKISLKGKSRTTQKSPVDKHGETNPRWNFRVEYTVSESAVQQPGVNVVIKLFCKRTLGDRSVGEVKIPLKSLFDVGIKSEKITSYTVSGTPNGRLNILYSFGEKIWVPKNSGWKTAIGFGFLVLVGGALIMLGEQSDEDEDDDHDGDGCDDEDVHVDDDGGFYDAR